MGEVHEVAEQLEHIQSDKLLDELDKMLGYPKFDPHGDPIPDSTGKVAVIKARPCRRRKLQARLKWLALLIIPLLFEISR